MKNLIILGTILLSFSFVKAQNYVSGSDFLDNQQSYIGKTISIWVSYCNCGDSQLRAISTKKVNDGSGVYKFKQYKNFNLFDPWESITINIPYKFFENNGALLPNVSDGGSFLATVYVYKGYSYKIGPEADCTYNDCEKCVGLELVSIKRK